MNTLEKIFSKTNSGAQYSKEYTTYLSELLENLDVQIIDEIVKVFINARADGKNIFFVGNGGSAATSSHFSEDLSMGTFVNGKKPFKAISLTDNVAYITALANDNGYENVFVGQLKTLFKPGDVIVGISASGNSPNVIKAIEYANKHKGISIGLVGFDGGKMKDICKYCIHIKTMKGEYGPVEDIHLIIGHLICTYLKFRLIDE